MYGAMVRAMSAAKPVVAPRLGCVPEYLREGSNILYNSKDPDALMDALQEGMGMDSSGMGKKNYCFVREDLAWEKVGKQTRQVYDEVLTK